MWKCKNCAEEIEDNFEFCWNCGSDHKGNKGDREEEFNKAKIEVDEGHSNLENKKRSANIGSIVVGFIILVIGIYYSIILSTPYGNDEPIIHKGLIVLGGGLLLKGIIGFIRK